MITIRADSLEPLQLADVTAALLMSGAEDVARLALRAAKTGGFIGPAARSAMDEVFRRQGDVAAMIDAGLTGEMRAWGCAEMLAEEGFRFFADDAGMIAGIRDDLALVGDVEDWRQHFTTAALRVARRFGGSIAGRGRLQVVA